jgi:protoporphyrin/coproporphyrin ferrochelatase
MARYDALLVVSFGGPSGADEVMPFLERVTRGRGVPRERLEEVAEHYYRFGGTSPIHERTRELVQALGAEIELPVYLGNRHSAPFLADTVRAMRDAGVARAIAFVTSAFSSYSSCRAYLDDLEAARAEVAGAPEIEKIRPFYNHPGYVETCTARLAEVLPERENVEVFFSAHSIPTAMADRCAYRAELAELAELVSSALGLLRWRVVFQSRSGPPEVPWLEPDVGDALRELAERAPGATAVVAPFGFVADHMEVVYDLDVALREEAERLGLSFVRAEAANAHPRFVRMVRELVEERASGFRAALGPRGALPDRCPPDCCPSPRLLTHRAR